MKKSLAIFILIALATLNLSAAFIPTYDKVDDGYFESPARLREIEKKTTFGFNASFDSDIDTLRFLSNPSATLGKSADYLADYLSSQSLEFWENNQALMNVFSALSANFPNDVNSPTFLDEVRMYFNGEFRSSEYGDARRAWAVVNSLDANNIYPNDPFQLLGGRMDIGLQLFGGEIKNGFGWDWQINFNYNNSDSLLSSFSNRMSMDVRTNVGYALYLGNEKVMLGFSVQPQLRFETSFSNSEFMSARMNDSLLDLFVNNTLDFGLGVGVNIGLMYRPFDTLAFTLDLRDAPSFQAFFYLVPTEIVSDFKFHRDENVYFIAPDVALTALWDSGPYHIEVEISDIVNQLVWQAMTDYHFNFFAVPKFRFTYDVNDDISLIGMLEYEALKIGVSWQELYAEISTRLDRAAIGVKMGYRF